MSIKTHSKKARRNLHRFKQRQQILYCQCVLTRLFQPQVGFRLYRGLLSCPYGCSTLRVKERVAQRWALALLHPLVNEQHSCTFTNSSLQAGRVWHSKLSILRIFKTTLTRVQSFIYLIWPCLVYSMWHRCVRPGEWIHCNHCSVANIWKTVDFFHVFNLILTRLWSACRTTGCFCALVFWTEQTESRQEAYIWGNRARCLQILNEAIWLPGLVGKSPGDIHSMLPFDRNLNKTFLDPHLMAKYGSSTPCDDWKRRTGLELSIWRNVEDDVYVKHGAEYTESASY